MAVGDKVISPIWGSKPFEITQEFGTYSPDTASMYPGEYTEPLGYPAGTHVGLDIGVPKNTPLFAINPGKVIQAGESPYFRPKPVWIETQDNPDTIKDESGFIEIYGHMWTNKVKKGDRVRPGTLLGTSGQQTKGRYDNQGNLVGATMEPDGTGPHLHFELRRPTGGGNYRAVNPRSWVTVKQTDTTDEDSPVEPVPEPEPTEDTGIGLPSVDIMAILGPLGKRLTWVLIGIIFLAIGLWVVLH